MSKSTGKKSTFYAYTGVAALAADRIGHVTKIGDVTWTQADVDFTDLDSNGVVETQGGNIDYGSIDIEGFYLDDGLDFDKLDGFKGVENVNFGIAHPTNIKSNRGFKGRVSKVTVHARTSDAPITWSATIRLTSPFSVFTPPVAP